VKKVLMFLNIVVVCLIGWLLLAVRWTKMDAMTMRLPTTIRRVVARRAIDGIFLDGYNENGVARAERTIRIDPENATAWEYVGQMEETSPPCDAESAFEKALLYERLKDRTTYMSAVKNRDLGQSALKCGHLQNAHAAFDRSRALYEEVLANQPNDTNLKQDVMFSHYYLSAYWSRVGDEVRAKQECQVALPDYKSECTCRVGDESTSCSGH
jgi:hypothetical protein